MSLLGALLGRIGRASVQHRPADDLSGILAAGMDAFMRGDFARAADLSEQAQKQFEIVYRREALDESADADVEVLTLSWCRRAGDPRRVICLISGAERKVLPLWWDPQHQVSGDNGREPNAAPCPGGCLHGDSKQH